MTLHRTWQADPNALIESFDGRLRELLNETLFTSLAQVRDVLASWKDGYNDVRPHSALGNVTPKNLPTAAFPDRTGRSAALPRGRRVPPRCSTKAPRSTPEGGVVHSIKTRLMQLQQEVPFTRSSERFWR